LTFVAFRPKNSYYDVREIFMKYAIAVCSLLLSLQALGQTDDVRQATGLPIPIGAPVIYGQVRIRGLDPKEARPLVHVSLIVGGAQADRMQVNERGYYYFLKSPSDNTSLLFEVNNNEVGRVVLAAGTGSSVRRDIDIDLGELRKSTVPAVVSVQAAAYSRSSEAQHAYDKAMLASRAKSYDEAATLFKQIVEKDSKDFVVWTELGTVFFNQSRLDEAESSYARALDLKADFLPALMNSGKLFLSQKKFDKAAPLFYKAVTTDPNSADGFHYLGETYLQMKQGSKAVLAFNEALRLAPKDKAEIHLRMALLYNAAGVKDRAANEYKMFLQKVPNHPDKEKFEKYIKENLQ
jgi:tetratricopeptide (TPR) repeat protein